MKLDAKSFDIPGPVLITPKRFGDARGFFSETYSAKDFSTIGIAVPFVQDNHALTAKKGTIRGLHFQVAPKTQDKLVRVVRGSVYDVAVDIRRNSPTYGRYVGVELSAENWQQLFVPRGFAHGYCTLESNTEVLYKTSDFYAPECEGGCLWNDKTLNIAWPTFSGKIVSERDANLPSFAELHSPFVWES